MFRFTVSAVLAGAVAMATAPFCQAAAITWQTPQNISAGTNTVTTVIDPTTNSAYGGPGYSNPNVAGATNDVDTTGTQLMGINFTGHSGSTWPLNVTITAPAGPQVFYSYTVNVSGTTTSIPSPARDGDPVNLSTNPIVQNGYSLSASSSFHWSSAAEVAGVTMPGGVPTFVDSTTSAAAKSYGGVPNNNGRAPEAVLGNALYGSTTQALTLGGLTIGKTYEVQLWASGSEIQGATGSVSETFAGDGLSTSSALTFSSGTGQYVIGSFVADAATQSINIASTSGNTQLNLFQLREITPEAVVPEPASLSFLALGGLLLARRRR